MTTESEHLEAETIIRQNMSWNESLECTEIHLGVRRVRAEFRLRENHKNRATISYPRKHFDLLRARFRDGLSVHWRTVEQEVPA